MIQFGTKLGVLEQHIINIFPPQGHKLSQTLVQVSYTIDASFDHASKVPHTSLMRYIKWVLPVDLVHFERNMRIKLKSPATYNNPPTLIQILIHPAYES